MALTTRDEREIKTKFSGEHTCSCTNTMLDYRHFEYCSTWQYSSVGKRHQETCRARDLQLIYSFARRHRSRISARTRNRSVEPEQLLADVASFFHFAISPAATAHWLCRSVADAEVAGSISGRLRRPHLNGGRTQKHPVCCDHHHVG